MSDGKKRIRLSGAQYAKVRAKKEAFLLKQKGAMLKFIKPGSQDKSPMEQELPSEESTVNPDSETPGEMSPTSSTSAPQNAESVHVLEEESPTDVSMVEELLTCDSDFSSSFLEDPGLWPSMTIELRDFLVKYGPHQVKSFNFPKDKSERKRSFHRMHYWRTLPNMEKVERPWLMYSKSKNAAYCFCCKVFQKELIASALSSKGTNNWQHLCRNLTCHEKTPSHERAFHSWLELRTRLQLKSTIDAKHQEKIEVDTKHWENVLKRLIAIIRVLATPNLALRGKSDNYHCLAQTAYLKIVKLIGEFEPEHLRSVTSKETHIHYLGKKLFRMKSSSY